MGSFIAYFVVAAGRIIIWLIAYHVGLSLWLFPEYRSSWWPHKFLYPILDYKQHKNAFSPGSLVFRTISGSLILYSIFQLC